ncbi:2-oxoglutarate dehydrogenase E1 subunit family protein [Rathayibacter rathayi]|uniref:2-oxoglutarate dehydrogenase E1 subunit family protein n=1 Tax=Rathayibacter rathayi TaxID=33887 RepID=UPI003BAC9140
MSSQLTGAGTEQGAEDFGANEWLVEELYEQYSADRASVDESWWPILERYGAQLANSGKTAPAPAPPRHSRHRSPSGSPRAAEVP